MAKALIAGDYGRESVKIAQDCCFPIYWSAERAGIRRILQNGSVTLVRTSERLFGVTAAHVLRGYHAALEQESGVQLQLGHLGLGDMARRLISITPLVVSEDSEGKRVESNGIDLATFEITEEELSKLGRPAVPLSLWPPLPPEIGSGIMLAGWPGGGRTELGPRDVEFLGFYALGIAQTVNHDQITFQVSREHDVAPAGRRMPGGYDLGGISGGPMIATFERGNFVTFRLCGIIVDGWAEAEYLVARRAEFIQADGSISRS